MKTQLIRLLALLAVPAFAAPPPGGKEPAARPETVKPAETARPVVDKPTPTEEKQEAVNIPAEDKRGPADAGTPPPKANKKRK